MKKFASLTALILLSTALGGCPSAKKLLEGQLEGGGDETAEENGGGETEVPRTLADVNAVGGKATFKCDATGTLENCGKTIVFDPNQAKPKSVKVVRTVSGDGQTASYTVDGVAVSNLYLKENDRADQTQVQHEALNASATAMSFKSVYVNPYDSGNHDEFFFFEVENGSVNRADGKGAFDSYQGVDGTLAAKEKVKTAKYVGHGALNVEFVNADGTVSKEINAANVTSEINANLNGNTPTLNAKLTVGSVYDEVTDMSSTTGFGVGATVEINNAFIDGNKFGGGTIVLKDADGITAADFNDSVFVGGFFGTDADFAAGVFEGQGVGVTNHVGKPVWIDGQIWGEKQAPAQ